MLTDDQLGGVRKPDTTTAREIKVKLSYHQLQMLRYFKMRSNQTFSEVVRDALDRFFAEKVVEQREPKEAPSRVHEAFPLQA